MLGHTQRPRAGGGPSRGATGAGDPRYVCFEVAAPCVFKLVEMCTKHLFSTFENMLREHSRDSVVALGESFFLTYLENSPSLTISHTLRNPRKVVGGLRELVALDQQSGLSIFSMRTFCPPALSQIVSDGKGTSPQ